MSCNMFWSKGEKDNGNRESLDGLLPKSEELDPKTGTLPVVSSHFCTLNYSHVFTVQKRRNGSCSGGDIIINDSDSFPFARADACHCRLQEKRILRNASGKPFLTLKRKLLSMSNEWEVYRGETTDLAKLLFRARSSFSHERKTAVKVYMSYNNDDEQWNFIVKGDYLERESVFYYGARTIAELSRKRGSDNEMLGRDTFLIKVEPGVDYVFIMALLVILDEVNRKFTE